MPELAAARDDAVERLEDLGLRPDGRGGRPTRQVLARPLGCVGRPRARHRGRQGRTCAGDGLALPPGRRAAASASILWGLHVLAAQAGRSAADVELAPRARRVAAGRPPDRSAVRVQVVDLVGDRPVGRELAPVLAQYLRALQSLGVTRRTSAVRTARRARVLACIGARELVHRAAHLATRRSPRRHPGSGDRAPPRRTRRRPPRQLSGGRPSLCATAGRAAG